MRGQQYFADQRINSDKCGAKVVELDEPVSNQLVDDGNAQFYISFRELINDFGTNHAVGTDTLEMKIYSDYLKKTFTLKNSFQQDQF